MVASELPEDMDNHWKAPDRDCSVKQWKEGTKTGKLGTDKLKTDNLKTKIKAVSELFHLASFSA